MANLVSPGYNTSSLINEILVPNEERVLEFMGLNRKPVVAEGEMSDMRNMTSGNYPMLTPRKPRGVYALPGDAARPLDIMTRYGKIALIATDGQGDPCFYFDGAKVTSVTGLSLDSRMVAINTKICFFPQKTYLEVTQSGSGVTIGSFGSLEDSATLTSKAVTISNEDARIDAGSGHSFAYDDAVNLVGTLSYTSSGTSKTAACNVSCVIEQMSGTTLVLPRETFIEMTGEGATNVSFTGTVSRTMPDLDYVIEWNNRLWGAVDADNTIYACKLGDPKNWQYYQGTSLDSFYAQQGTDGVWTGCAHYSNHLIFFKQNSMARIYGSAPSNFQITNTECYGVELGSRKSVVTINDRVFYKSTIGIMAYDGGTPYCISDKLNTRYKTAVGGTEGTKYYCSAQSVEGGYELMVLDIDKAEWHKEDNLRIHSCCTLDNKLYFVKQGEGILFCGDDAICSDWLLVGGSSADAGYVGIVNPENPAENYADMQWHATFGPFDEYIENKKIYSKILIRLVPADINSQVSVYISIDEGPWELVKAFDPVPKGGEFIPIIPRRCDRYSIKVEGKGNCAIKSLTRRVRRGTGGKL